jgi:hypothetical protein
MYSRVQHKLACWAFVKQSFLFVCTRTTKQMIAKKFSECTGTLVASRANFVGRRGNKLGERQFHWLSYLSL